MVDSDGESDGSDRVPVPSFQNSFSQAVEAAFLQLDHSPPAKAEAPPTSGQLELIHNEYITHYVHASGFPIYIHIYLYIFCPEYWVAFSMMWCNRSPPFPFSRWERRKEKEEETETSLQHLHGSHQVNETADHSLTPPP